MNEISLSELESLGRFLLKPGGACDAFLKKMGKEFGLQKVSAQFRARLEWATASLLRVSEPQWKTRY